MAKNKIGTCDVCGTKGETRDTGGVNACATCVKIAGYVRNHIGRIVELARLTGKQDELVRALGLSDDAATTAARSEDDAAAGRAWRMLMDEVERHGLVKVTATEPEAMIRQFMESATAPADELAALKKHAAELLGCPQDEIVPALRLTEATLRTIREVVEPELEGEEYGSLPEACRLLVARYHAVRDAEHDAAEDEARTVELETRLMEAEREQDRLRERLRERLKTGADPTEDALLQWAIRKYQAGKITLQIEVQEMEAAA